MAPLIRIALRNVLRNRRRSLITLSAVFLAVGVMTAVRGVLNGLQAAIRETVIATQTGALQVHKKGFARSLQAPIDLDLPADEAFLGKIRAVPGVVEAAPRIPFGGMVNANDKTVFSIFVALDPAREPRVCPQRWDILGEGKPLDVAVEDGAALSDELLKRLGVPLGGTAALLTNNKDGTLGAVDVKATGRLGGVALPLPDQRVVFVPLALAQKLLLMEGRATEIAISVKDPAKVDEVARALQAALGDEYEVATWGQIAPFVDDVIRTQNIMLTIVAAIFGIIALVGIAVTMLMNTLERTREVGTMMALGVRRRQILVMFLLESMLLGIAGVLAGGSAGGGFILRFATGAGLAIQIPGSNKPLLIHTFVTAPYVGAVLAVAALGATAAAFLPAWWASRLRPVEALAHA